VNKHQTADFFLSLLLPEPEIKPARAGPEDLKTLSMRHGLFPLIYTQVMRHEKSLEPDFTRVFLHDYHPIFLKSASISAVQERVEGEILSLLRNASIPGVLIKGNMIARRIYADPNSRISSDIDILIRLKDATRTEEHFLREGFLPEEKMPLKYCLSRIHHVTYIHPGAKIPVEVHWNFGIPYLFDLTSGDIWKEVQEDGREGLTLSDGMFLIMLFIHHHSHSFRELRILVDILWSLWRFRGSIDPSSLEERIDRFGLSKVAGLTFSQIEDLWPGWLWKTGFDPLARALKGRKPGKILIRYFSPDPGLTKPVSLYRDKLLARFLLRSPGRTVLSFFRTLFPPRAAIDELYGKAGLIGLSVNYLRFVFWRISDWLRSPAR
jgi:hypothetical protein